MKKKDYLLFIFLLILAVTGLIIHFKLNLTEETIVTTAVMDSREQIELPILMYHGITENAQR